MNRLGLQQPLWLEGSGYLVETVLCVLVGIFLFRAVPDFLRWAQRTEAKGHGERANLALAAAAVLLTVFLSELGAFVLGGQTDFSSATLSSRSWFRRNWAPVNSYGFRDEPWDERSIAGKRVLLVLGDSVTAGHGIKDYRNRFQNRLESLLGPPWRSITFAECGWSTQNELAALEEYGKQAHPEIVILAYYPNDIEGAASAKHPIPKFLTPPQGLPGWLIRHSFSLNMLYWRYLRSKGSSIGDAYWRFSKASFNDPEIWEAHSAELRRISDRVRELGAKLVVLLVPDLSNRALSDELLGKVKQTFSELGDPTVEAETILKGLDGIPLTVNSADGHPSVPVHEAIAKLLYERLKEFTGRR